MNHWLLGAYLSILCLSGCAHQAAIVDTEKFVESSDTVQLIKGESSIVDFVCALPAFSFHEASVEAAHESIRKQNITKRLFRGHRLDSIRYEGDGSAGASTFFLEHESGNLWSYYHAWEAFNKDSITRYRIAEGGWLTSVRDASESEMQEQSRIMNQDRKNAEQGVPAKSDRSGG